MQQPQTPEVTITLSIDQLNTVLSLLGTHPFNQVADMIVAIRQQAGEQLQQMQAGQPAPRLNGEARAPA